MGNKPLKNEKHELFCHKYLEFKNSTDAYSFVFPNAGRESCASSGSQLFRKDNIKERISYLSEKIKKEAGLNAKWVIDRLMALADADIREVVDWDEEKVTLKPSSTISDRAAYCVSEIRSQYRIDDDGSAMVNLSAKTVTPADKLKALEALGKHINLFESNKGKPSNLEKFIRNLKGKKNE